MAENTSQAENLTVVSENKAAVTVAIVIGAYGLTGLPKFVFLVVQLLMSTTDCGFSYFERCARWIVTVAYTNPAWDPLIYAFRMKLFRDFIRNQLFRKCRSSEVADR